MPFDVAAVAERHSVQHVESQLRVCRERLDVVGAQIAAPVIAAVLAGEAVAGEDFGSPPFVGGRVPLLQALLGAAIDPGVSVFPPLDGWAGSQTRAQLRSHRRRQRPAEVTEASLLSSGDLNLDSLDFVEVTMEIEDAFDVELNDDKVSAVVTVGDLVSYVAAALGLVEVPA
jgi:acyl carrier protein